MKEKKINKKIEEILIDFGNHYVEACKGKSLKLKFYRDWVRNLINKEKLLSTLEATIDARDFIKETPNHEDLLSAFNGQIADLKESKVSRCPHCDSKHEFED